MKQQLEYAKDIRGFARQFFWNLTPEEALEDTSYFLAHVMARVPKSAYDHVCTHFGFTKNDFIEALKNAPPGLFVTIEDWEYWNDFLGITPHWPMPQMYSDVKIATGAPCREIPSSRVLKFLG